MRAVAVPGVKGYVQSQVLTVSAQTEVVLATRSCHQAATKVMNITVSPYGSLVSRYLPIRSFGMVGVWLGLSLVGFYIADCLVFSKHGNHMDLPIYVYMLLFVCAGPIVSRMQSQAICQIEVGNPEQGRIVFREITDLLSAGGYTAVESSPNRVIHRRLHGIFGLAPWRNISDFEVQLAGSEVQVIGLTLAMDPLLAQFKKRNGETTQALQKGRYKKF